MYGHLCYATKVRISCEPRYFELLRCQSPFLSFDVLYVCSNGCANALELSTIRYSNPNVNSCLVCKRNRMEKVFRWKGATRRRPLEKRLARSCNKLCGGPASSIHSVCEDLQPSLLHERLFFVAQRHTDSFSKFLIETRRLVNLLKHNFSASYDHFLGVHSKSGQYGQISVFSRGFVWLLVGWMFRSPLNSDVFLLSRIMFGSRVSYRRGLPYVFSCYFGFAGPHQGQDQSLLNQVHERKWNACPKGSIFVRCSFKHA